MFQPIDFDVKFTQYAEKWMKAELSKGRKAEDLEDEMPDVYIKFLNTPASWLDGAVPGMFFAKWDDPEELIEILKEYEKNGTPIPDPLLERITDLGKVSETPLSSLASDENAPHALRVTAMNLLIELEAVCTDLCIRLVLNREDEDDLADAAADLLRNTGRDALEQLLSAMDEAEGAALDTLLDLLCEFPGDERIYQKTLERFLSDPDHLALHASFLAKLGDARAIEPLKKMSTLTELNYRDYIEIRDAVEELGGSLDTEREFAGDPYYESLKDMG